MLSENCPLTPTGNRTRPSETLLGQWIKLEWIDILSESIIIWFKNQFHMICMEQKMVTCRRKIIKRILL
jgi:hypothetical protein